MPDLPKLAITSRCPDPDCKVPPGQPHHPECEVAVCLTTGEQRLLHDGDALAELLQHNCGADIWTGERRGVAECREYAWYVRPATADERALDMRWVPCAAGVPSAVPDLDRLARHATWSPTELRWFRQREVAGRG